MRLIKFLSSAAVLAVIFSVWFFSSTSEKNPDRPLPPAGSAGVFRTTADETRIFVHTFLPEGPAAATIYLLSGITGINHVAERDMIESLSNGKNRVVVIHPRGTGYSEGRRGDGKDFSKFIDDYVEIISRDIRSGNADGNVILFGHSMSCAVVLAVAEKVSGVNGAILVNPPYKRKAAEGMTPGIGDYVKYAAYYLLARHTPIVNMAGDPGSIRREEERKEAEARGKDPLLVKYFSLYYMMESKKLIDAMVARARNADYPLLLVYGTGDGIVDQRGCDEIFAAWKSPAKKYELIENGPHGKLTVFKAAEKLQAWISALPQRHGAGAKETPRSLIL
jgi:alpha-beta hydrolase superfamily lysophospholipase